MTLPTIGTAPSGFATAAGRHRETNQDAVLAGPEFHLVADGMGGHAAGDVASRLVVETFAAATFDRTDPTTSIVTACDAAHLAIRRRAAADDTFGMGSTVVGLVETSAGWVVFHVGDSRCYRLVAGELRLVTRDHSQVQELIDAGRLTSEQARLHPLRNVVTRALGHDGDHRPDVALLDRRPSRYLLCSDGLTAELSPQTIGRVLTGVADATEAAERLVELAFDGEAHDDTTALVVDTPTIGDNEHRAAHHTAADRPEPTIP